MDRAQHLAPLGNILNAIRTQQQDSQGMDHLGRAADLRTIVAAMLNDQVACLPDTGKVCSRRDNIRRPPTRPQQQWIPSHHHPAWQSASNRQD